MDPIMPLREFVELHRPALERDEAKHNLILGILAGALNAGQSNLQLWTLGPSGACAIQTPGYPIVLGELNAAQCFALAEQTLDLHYPGVVGPDQTARLFAERATLRGAKFAKPMRQLIHTLRDRPVYPGVPGSARPVDLAAVAQFADWMIAFLKEAIPHDPLPSPEHIEKTAREGNYWFWIADGEPVSMAGVVRRTRHAAAIGGVYTPPALRRHGYAGSVTAALVESVFAEGRAMVCLYTDLSNPASNRCYAKIGFEPLCQAEHYPRVRQ